MSYIDTLITVAPDCPVNSAEVPGSNRAKKPIHLIQYELLTQAPYTYDHEGLIFKVYLIKEGLEDLSEDEKVALWEQMFSKGHPCMRASALCKRYGFGAHYNDEGKIAIYPMDSSEYRQMVSDDRLSKIPAMRTRRP